MSGTFIIPAPGTGGGSSTATALDTTGAAVDVSAAAPPSAGQVLKATDATHATWQTPTATVDWAQAGLAYSSARVEAFSRYFATASSSNAQSASGTVYVTFFEPGYGLTASALNISVPAAGATGATTYFAMGLYTVDASNNGTLVAHSANDTTYGGSAAIVTGAMVTTNPDGTAGSYPTSYALVAGTRYAFAHLYVGTFTTPPHYMCSPGTPLNAANNLAPRLCGIAATGQTTLPTSITGASLTSITVVPWYYAT
jgi:hypothetical protein